MAISVQITLIICGMIIISNIISTFGNKQELNQVVEIKSPTYERPSRLDSRIGHNPPAEGERPGVPGGEKENV